MPAFNQSALNYRAQNGNKVSVLIGDQPLGFAQNVGSSFGFGTAQLYGIGASLPQEVQQLRTSPHISINMFALSQNGLNLLGYPTNLALILAQNEFNFYIQDGVTNKMKFMFVGGVCSDFNETIPTNQIITDTFTFMCADVLGPDGKSILNVSDAYTFPALATGVTSLANTVNAT